MALAWLVLAGCGWWEARQACTHAQEANTQAWSTFAQLADDGQAAAARAAQARVDAAGAVDTAMTEAVAGAPQVQQVNPAAAQDAFTAASRAGGNSGQAALDARAADYTTQTQHASAEADRAAERALRESEGVAVWGQAYKEAGLSLALAAARYEALVRPPSARAAMVLDLHLAASLTPALPEDNAASAAKAVVESRRANFAVQRENFGIVLQSGETLAFAADRAGQLASTRSRDIDFLDFPLSAQYARAAAAGAAASGTRAIEAGRRLREVVATWKEAEGKSTVKVPAELSASLDAAKAAWASADELCK